MSSQLRERTQFYTRLQYGLAVGLALFLVGFWLLGYRPVILESQSLRTRVESQRSELSVAKSRADDLPRLEAENDALSMRLARAKRLPRQQEWADFVRDITRLGTQFSLRRFEYKYGQARREDTFSQLPLELDFEGEMLNVYSFLRQTEELPRLTRLRSISMQTTDKPGHVRVQMALNTYFATEQ